MLMGEPSSGRRTLAKHLTLLYTCQSVDDLEEGNQSMRQMIMCSITQQLQMLAQVAENQLGYEFGDFVSFPKHLSFKSFKKVWSALDTL